MADLRSDPRISEVNDERRDGMGLWAYANDRDGYFIEGGSDTGSYVQIHEDSLREVLKQANRIKHLSEFSESEKENLRQWAKSNDYTLKENPMKSIRVGDKVMGIMGVSGGYAGTVIAIKRDGRHNVIFYKDDDGAVYETLDSNITKNVPEKGKFPRKNPVNPTRVYTTYSAWRAAAKKAGATRFEGGKDDIAQAWDSSGSWIGEWDGAEGFINKSKENPVKPRRGESERDFVSRCMSEEKKSFPEPKQRIAVCLSKARRNPFNDRNLDE
jgi:hypothetical protein